VSTRTTQQGGGGRKERCEGGEAGILPQWSTKGGSFGSTQKKKRWAKKPGLASQGQKEGKAERKGGKAQGVLEESGNISTIKQEVGLERGGMM